MSNYYLDIETTGLDPKIDSIITIQFQELDRFGNPKGKLIILKSWEFSEKEIVNHFIQIYKGNNSSPFNFIAIGFNLNFEYKFLKEKAKQYGFGDFDILENPSIDLKSIGVLMNNGNFVGSGLDKISGKETDGKLVPEWYNNQEYDKIMVYITMETREFVKLYVWLCKEMPSCQKRFREELEDKS